MRQHRLRAQKAAGDVDGHDAFPGREARVFHAAEIGDAGIVDEHVDHAGIATNDLPKRLGYAVRIGHIDAEGSGVHPLLAQLGFGRFCQCAIAL
jgi:hypothetical protein